MLFDKNVRLDKIPEFMTQDMLNEKDAEESKKAR